MKCCNFLQIWIESETFIVLGFFSLWYKSDPFWKENGDNKIDFKVMQLKKNIYAVNYGVCPFGNCHFQSLFSIGNEIFSN